MKILFLGDIDLENNFMAFSKVGNELFSRAKENYTEVHLYLYFQEGKIFLTWKKFFGIEKINSNIKNVGIFSLIYLIIKFKPKIIQITSHSAYYIPGILIAKLFGIKISFLMHNIYKHTQYMDLPLNGYLKWKVLLIERILLKTSDLFLLLSNREKKTLLKYYSTDEKKIRIISNGINLYNTKKYYINKNYPIKIVTVGLIDRLEKGIDFLFEVTKLFKFDFQLTICANKEQDPKLMSKYINNKVKFLPPMDEEELRNEYIQNDLFVALSRYDSFNMSLLEAMNTGLLFIASERVGLTERFPRELQKFVVPFGDKDSVLRALQLILNLSLSEEQMLSDKIIQFSKDYSWDAVAKKYFKIYDTILS